MKCEDDLICCIFSLKNDHGATVLIPGQTPDNRLSNNTMSDMLLSFAIMLAYVCSMIRYERILII